MEGKNTKPERATVKGPLSQQGNQVGLWKVSVQTWRSQVRQKVTKRKTPKLLNEKYLGHRYSPC